MPISMHFFCTYTTQIFGNIWMRVCSEKMDLPVISEVNPQYFKLKQINKCIRKFKKKIGIRK